MFVLLPRILVLLLFKVLILKLESRIIYHLLSLVLRIANDASRPSPTTTYFCLLLYLTLRLWGVFKSSLHLRLRGINISGRGCRFLFLSAICQVTHGTFRATEFFCDGCEESVLVSLFIHLLPKEHKRFSCYEFVISKHVAITWIYVSFLKPIYSCTIYSSGFHPGVRVPPGVLKTS